MADTRLPTRAEYDAATPRQKGFMAYTYSAWPGSEIPDESVGVREFDGNPQGQRRFLEGVQAAVLAAQDSEE